MLWHMNMMAQVQTCTLLLGDIKRKDCLIFLDDIAIIRGGAVVFKGFLG